MVTKEAYLKNGNKRSLFKECERAENFYINI